MDKSNTFSAQLSIKLDIVNKEKLYTSKKQWVLGGMGGSHLAAGLLKIWRPGIDLYVHRDYDLLPYSKEFFSKSICIASSYSGNTEETLSFYKTAKENNFDMVVITSGGQLLEFAKENADPYILLPDDLQPRDALGFFLTALSLIIGDEKLEAELNFVGAKSLEISEKVKSQVNNLVLSLQNKVPVIYSSVRNLPLAYIWKIKFNETSKVPAFYNIFPELNHNEMEGFDTVSKTKSLSENLIPIIIKDSVDDPRVIERMTATREILKEKGLETLEVYLEGDNAFSKIAFGIELANEITHELATFYGVDPDEVSLISEFKKRIS